MEYLQYYAPKMQKHDYPNYVLNLVINGIPSIQKAYVSIDLFQKKVLNLVISGIPSIPKSCNGGGYHQPLVLNLIITGIPSILKKIDIDGFIISFEF